MNADNNEKVEQIEDLSDLEEAERIEINISSPSTEPYLRTISNIS